MSVWLWTKRADALAASVRERIGGLDGSPAIDTLPRYRRAAAFSAMTAASTISSSTHVSTTL
jgi:hypothetical protein